MTTNEPTPNDPTTAIELHKTTDVELPPPPAPPPPAPPVARQGNSYELGTRVFVHGIAAPDTPPSFGVVVGYEPVVSFQVEQRHVVAMEQGGEWTCDFVDLEVIDPARRQELIDAALAATEAIGARRAVESRRT